MNLFRSIIKNTFYLTFGQIAAKILSVLFVALLARAIGPEGVGKYALYGSIIAIFMILPDFGFDMLLVREVAKSCYRRNEFIANILSIKLGMNILASCLLLFFIKFKQYNYQTTQIILLLHVSFILISIITSFYSIFQAYEKMGFQAILMFVNNLLRLVFGLIAIKLGMKLKGIIMGLVLADFLTLLLGAGLIHGHFTSLRLKMNPTVMKQIFLSVVPFGILTLINVVWTNTDILMIAKLVNEKAVGWYSAANRILLFVLLIPNMFMKVIFPIMSRLNGSDINSLRQTYSKSFAYMLMIGFPVAVGGFLVSGQIVFLIYGELFHNTILVFRIMVWVTMFGFASYLNGATLNAIGREKFFAATFGGFVLANIILDYIFIKKFSYLGACYVTLILTFLGFIIYSTICHLKLKVKPEWLIIAKSFIAAIVMGGIVFLLKKFLVNIFIVIPISVLTYFALIFLLRAIPTKDASALLSLFKLSLPKIEMKDL